MNDSERSRATTRTVRRPVLRLGQQQLNDACIMLAFRCDRLDEEPETAMILPRSVGLSCQFVAVEKRVLRALLSERLEKAQL